MLRNSLLQCHSRLKGLGRPIFRRYSIKTDAFALLSKGSIRKAKTLLENNVSDDAEAAYILGTLYLRGDLRDPDLTTVDSDAMAAKSLLEDAGNRGIADAFYVLATQYRTGTCLGFEHSDILAEVYLKKAAEMKHPLALFTLGAIHYEGQRPKKSLEYFQKASEEGDIWALIATIALLMKSNDNNERNNVIAAQKLIAHYLKKEESFDPIAIELLNQWKKRMEAMEDKL